LLYESKVKNQEYVIVQFSSGITMIAAPKRGVKFNPETASAG
jgi:hypothetical protein